MNGKKAQVSAEALLTAEERIERRIGKDLALKYKDIETLLALLEYRFQEEREANHDCKAGLILVFFFDTLQGKKAATRLFGAVAAPVLWTATRIKYAFRKRAETRLAFSNTFLFSRRYPMVKDQVERKYGCTAVLSFFDTIKRSTPNAKEMLHDTLRLNSGSVRPVYIPRFSVAGIRLQRAVTDYYRLIHQDTVPAEILDQALARMRKAYLRRVGYLAKRLKKENLKLYITINQYNLRDLLMIHACREIGVQTMQQEHNAMQFSRLPFDPEHPKPRLSFVCNYGYWDATEKLFHEKVFRDDNLLYPPETCRVIISGNTEMSLEQAAGYQKKYPASRKLTFMSAAPTFGSKEEMEQFGEWRWAVLSALRKLSEKQGIPICIRYKPFYDQYFRERETPTLKEWGFTISESIPENLMEDICSSTVIMSSTTSVLSTALLLGKTVYRVEDPGIDYIHVNDRIRDVRVDEIPDIEIPDDPESTRDQINPDGFFDINRIISVI